MQKQVKCEQCQRLFWSKVVENKKTKETFADRIFCRRCENIIRHEQQIQGVKRIREVPKELNSRIVLKELAYADRERKT